MIKRVSVGDLRLGMYIHDLNCGWVKHSFIWNRFMLRRVEDLEKIKTLPTQEVLIDTLKGLDVAGNAAAPSIEVVEAGTEGEAVIPVSHEEELPVAQAIRAEAFEVIQSVLQDVRLGRQVDAERTEPVVSKITDSVLRNPGALVSLCRMKEGDSYTFQHCVSVATLLVAFCRFLGMEREVLIEAGMGGMLHDVGKMQVPDHILNKPGKLLGEEFEIMKAHVEYGVDILRETHGVSDRMIRIAGEHHERFDGTGYPKGLVGNDISQIGRMTAIVDVYDAITSNRVYQRGIEPLSALQKLYSWSEHHFDPELVQQFIKAIGIYPVGSLVLLASKRLAVVMGQGQNGLLFPVVRVVFDTQAHKRVIPYDIDLSQPDVDNDRILDEEDPFEWNIDPFNVMGVKS